MRLSRRRSRGVLSTRRCAARGDEVGEDDLHEREEQSDEADEGRGLLARPARDGRRGLLAPRPPSHSSASYEYDFMSHERSLPTSASSVSSSSGAVIASSRCGSNCSATWTATAFMSSTCAEVNPSLRLLSASSTPTTRHPILMGTARMERVQKPVSASTERSNDVCV